MNEYSGFIPFGLTGLINTNKLKWIKDLKVRPDIIKLLDENTGRTLLAINHSNIFCQSSPSVKEIKKKKKNNTWNLIKLTRFSTAKETVNKTNRKHTEWKKIF